MLLTQEIQDKLKSLCDGKTKIVIEGFNALGDLFTTKGKISKGDNETPVVHDKVVFLDFGKPTKRPYSDWVAPFETEFDATDAMTKSFIIKRISLESGEVLFENGDADKYLQQAQENMKAYEQNARAEGRWIEERDDVSSELMSLLAQPIRLDGEDCVLAELPRKSTNYGQSIIQVRRTTLAGSLFVDEKSTLETLNPETGELDYVVSNKECVFDNANIMKNRASKIGTAQTQNQSQLGEE